MKKHSFLNFFLAIIILTLVNCNKDDTDVINDNNDPIPEVSDWEEITSFPGQSRSTATSFELNGFGYVGLGYSFNFASFDYYSDFYKFNPANDSWSQISSFPGFEREDATSFVINNTAYVGLGYGEDSSGYYEFLKDLWKYNDATDTWTQINSFPDSIYISEQPATFVINNKAYLYFGDRNHLLEFNPTTETWIERTPLSEDRRNMLAFVIGTKAYVGLGYDYDYKVNFWEYDPSSDSWSQISDFPGDARGGAVSFSINGNGYLGAGDKVGDNTSIDFWKYDATHDSWTEVDSIEIEEKYLDDAVSFVIDDIAYVGTGDDGSIYANSSTKLFFKYDPE